MKIAFEYLGTLQKFNYPELTQKLIKEILGREKRQLGEISIIFTDNKHILSINKDYLKHSYYTDVITFNNSRKSMVQGDIFLSVEQIATNATKYGTSYDEELIRVIIHGILHLIGYDDVNLQDRVVMKSKEEEYVKAVNMNLFRNQDEAGI